MPKRRMEENLIFIAVAVSTMIVVSMLLYTAVTSPPSESFSVISILGPNQTATDYPEEVNVGETIDMYVLVENHENRAEYYVVRFKLGDVTTDISNDHPASLSTRKSYQKILSDGESWQFPVDVSINERGNDYRLIFELWRYNENTGDIEYTGNWVQIWLDVR
ncbi:DUF1616 domain-containing protein [Candidatus Borrarchaeum sp.]|uniref:DUF1616 domain-containing protein n=1 Tax=Candidatus Borrarchaeum sp. TaxID=2846742 RepID=UPI00257CB4C2|nr:DUF1616 domain-containing protein [Candidatus Borrarchaeum sp.]